MPRGAGRPPAKRIEVMEAILANPEYLDLSDNKLASKLDVARETVRAAKVEITRQFVSSRIASSVLKNKDAGVLVKTRRNRDGSIQYTEETITLVPKDLDLDKEFQLNLHLIEEGDNA